MGGVRETDFCWGGTLLTSEDRERRRKKKGGSRQPKWGGGSEGPGKRKSKRERVVFKGGVGGGWDKTQHRAWFFLWGWDRSKNIAVKGRGGGGTRYKKGKVGGKKGGPGKTLHDK